jgi:hypothetical protein
MIEVHALLLTKENELARVRREIEALRTVAPLLSEPNDVADLQHGTDRDAATDSLEPSLGEEEENVLQDELSPDSEEFLFHSMTPKRSRLRDWIGRAVGE